MEPKYTIESTLPVKMPQSLRLLFDSERCGLCLNPTGLQLPLPVWIIGQHSSYNSIGVDYFFGNCSYATQLSFFSMSSSNSLDTFDIGKAIQLYTRRWKLFLISIGIFLIAALIYLRYAVPQYASLAKIQILVDENSKTPELKLFSQANMMMPSNTLIDDEIEVLNSRSNFVEVAKNLGLNMKFSWREILETMNFMGTIR